MPKRKTKTIHPCPYCREEFPYEQTNKDHIPPRSLFPKPRPDDLITVRACKVCHEEGSEGDEFLKALAAIGLVRTKIPSQIKADVDGAIRRNSRWRKLFVPAIKAKSREIEVKVGGRKIIGHAVPIPTELADDLDRTIVRVAKGLLFRTFPEWDTRGLDFKVIQGDESDLEKYAESLKDANLNLRFFQQWKGIFWGALDLTKDRDGAMVLLNFYGGLNFAVFVTQSGALNAEPE